MTRKTPPVRPPVVRNITVASAVITVLCLLAGSFLLYSAITAPDPAAAFNVKLLSIVVIVVGGAYTVLTFAFFNLQPWSYSVMRAMVRGGLSPIFSLWGWYDAIDSEEVQRAFGVKLKRRR